MAPTFTPNLGLELQATGDNSGTWGGILNTDVFTILDTALGGIQALSLSASDVTVTSTQGQNNGFVLSGVLTADVAVIFPAIGRTYFIQNNTTGAHTVTLKCGTFTTTQVIPQGASGYYTLNVNDVLAPTLPVSAADLIAGILKAQTQLAGINLQTVSYTLVAGDAGKLVGINNASAVNLTIPPNSSVPFVIDTYINLYQYGAGQITIVAGLGVTIRSASGKLKLAFQYSAGALIKIGTDEWLLTGDLSA